jgi:NADH:ubiquinone oxidoreductase subunit E
MRKSIENILEKYDNSKRDALISLLQEYKKMKDIYQRKPL